jgi:hypothetical protein
MPGRLLVSVLCLALCALTLGCASIISGKRQDVMITSAPPGAQATVLRLMPAPSAPAEEGAAEPATPPPAPPSVQVAQTRTPGSVLLQRNEDYLVRVELEGYAPLEVKLTRATNWWVLGNGLFGLIGVAIGLAVDYGTGAAWRLTPDPLDVVLEAVKPAAMLSPPWRHAVVQ